LLRGSPFRVPSLQKFRLRLGKLLEALLKLFLQIQRRSKLQLGADSEAVDEFYVEQVAIAPPAAVMR
jgi:hypothetical protein